MKRVKFKSVFSWQVSQLLLAGLFLFAITSAMARGVYQTPDTFLQQVFDSDIPDSEVIWIKGEVRQTISDMLGHKYAGLRVRYWQRDERSAWILDEIGKEQPITFGVVVKNGRIERMKVLAFRESRGDEIRHQIFSQQFNDATLVDQQLDRHIDGISGATMSVRAMTDMARLALYLDNLISQAN